MNTQKQPGQVPDHSALPPHMAAKSPHPFQSSIDRVLSGQTDMGADFKPLLSALKALPEGRQNYTLETFKLIHGFFKGRRLNFDSYTMDDVAFLITDPVGDLIRRTLTHTYVAQKIDERVKTDPQKPGEEESKQLFLRYFSAQGWSHFVGSGVGSKRREEIVAAFPGEEIHVHTRQLLDDWTKSCVRHGEFNLRMMREGYLIAQEIFEPIEAKAVEMFGPLREEEARDNLPSVFFTDSRHAMDFRHTFLNLDSPVRHIMGADLNLPPLVREASFMFVEDNVLDRFWEGVLNQVKGLNRYFPDVRLSNLSPQDKLTTSDEMHGCYSCAERALEVIEKNAGIGKKPPDIILSDIDLGRDKMDGIAFVLAVHERFPETQILMLWTSNPELHTEDVAKLQREGIIKRSFKKREFTPGEFIEEVNKALSEK
ncbi:MAG: hypothetical protein KKD39_05315 [Candidatus Altiarchaeota archaeon]|nr:hypothetical protein [Candidatus Altiarchaeota archaeon]